MGRSFIATSPSRQDRANDRQQSARLIWREALHFSYLPDVRESRRFSPAISAYQFHRQKGGVPPAQPTVPSDFCDLELPRESHRAIGRELGPREQCTPTKDERRLK